MSDEERANDPRASLTEADIQAIVDKRAAAVEPILKEFEIDAAKLKELCEYFITCIEEGLVSQSEESSRGLPMIPTYVTKTPTGHEKGVFLAADLGGTNFRVCSVNLNGDSTFTLEQSKARIPDDLLNATTASELFSYLAKKIKAFVEHHHGEKADGSHYKLGFTFSYPVNQTALNAGTLIRWTKGFKIQDVVGKDVVQLLQKELDAIHCPVAVVALANDTVGTLLSHAYSTAASPNGKQGETVIGAIFGTGTNGCYLEPLDNIKKLDPKVVADLKAKGETHMIVNTEWGSFDNDLHHLPTTIYDEKIDKISSNPGFHMFEKRVSGMFMGEILRQILVDLWEKKLILRERYPTRLPHRLTTPFELDSEVLSYIEIDDSVGLTQTQLNLKQVLRLDTYPDERADIQKLVRAISRRSAYLATVPLAAIIMKTKTLEHGYHKEVEIGVDGSVVEMYPGFRHMMRHGLAESPLGPDGQRKIHIVIAKDGSGVGAALCASTTGQQV